MNSRALLTNPKAKFEYEILDTIEAGIALDGGEVKSVRSKKGSLIGSYVRILNFEAFLLGAQIHPYFYSSRKEEIDPQRTRKLLLKKSEIYRLHQLVTTQARTLVPLSLEIRGRRIKLIFAVARGKKNFEKRADIKERDTRRAAEREVKEKIRWK
jgi:SsrA-binding protein